MRKGLVLLLAVLLCAVLFVSCSQDKNRAVIYFNSNGGYGHMNPQPVTKGEETTLNANEFARTGWHLDHWNTTVTDMEGHRYPDGGQITVQQDTTLYAQWTANKYTVKYEPGEGTGTMPDQEFTYHEAQPLSENKFAKPADKEFISWKVKDSDRYYMEKEEVYDLTPVDHGEVILEAQWGKGLEYRKKIVDWRTSIYDYKYLKCRIAESRVTWLDADTTELETGWYAVKENLDFEDRIEIKGDVHLILCDNTTLTAPKGIDVSNGDKLTIYDQGITNDPIGKIVVSGTSAAGIAGIGGGTKEKPSGEIIIHGGNLDINVGEDGGAGIGGNSNASNGPIKILGGIINVVGEGGSAGIGSGFAATPGLIEIFGGKVTVTGTSAAGIGAGLTRPGGTIIIGGDAEIDAEVGGNEASAGIGGSNENYGGTIIIYGCTKITAKGGLRPEFDYGPEIRGSGIGGGNIKNEKLYGKLEYSSDKVKIEVSSDGKKWEAYDGKKQKQYMRVLPVTVE